jgi:hypothetical protein
MASTKLYIQTVRCSGERARGGVRRSNPGIDCCQVALPRWLWVAAARSRDLHGRTATLLLEHNFSTPTTHSVNMAQSDDEDDYMNMVFEDAPKGPKYETSLQRAARKRKEVRLFSASIVCITDTCIGRSQSATEDESRTRRGGRSSARSSPCYCSPRDEQGLQDDGQVRFQTGRCPRQV